MSTEPSRQRRRFAAEKRRTHLLDCAADLLARDGIAQLTMESIGRAAGVSKSLVYNYFDNVTQLLRELFVREMRTLRRAQLEAAERAATFEELVRGVTHAYLSYIARRGLIVERLQTEPSVTDTHDPTDFGRDAAVEYLTTIVVSHFDIPVDLARAVTDISFGLPVAAGQYLLHNDMSQDEVEDITVTMIMGTFFSIKNESLAKGGPLKRQPAAGLARASRRQGGFDD